MQMCNYDEFFIPYESTLGRIFDDEDDCQEAPGKTLCVETVRVVRALLDNVLEQFPGLGPAISRAFAAYDDGTLKYDLETGRILATT
jgi:hypothetical protein